MLTLATLYGILFLMADYRATVLCPILVGETHIRLRAGLRGSIRIPRESVIGIQREKPDLGREALSLSFLSPPSHWVLLDAPREFRGPYGTRRWVRALGLTPDHPVGFEAAIEASKG